MKLQLKKTILFTLLATLLFFCGSDASSEPNLAPEALTNNAAFSPRTKHTSVVFNNKIWVIGGQLSNRNNSNDVWSSVNGIDWVKENGVNKYVARSFHTSIVFNEKAWLLQEQTLIVI